jgi:DNA-binding NtrC family response regulator
MTNQTQNLFIVEDNAENSLKLHQFLEKRFGTIFNISTFTDSVKALSKVDENTSIVVLDYDYFGEEGTKIVNFIKNINKNTKVIILSNNEEIGNAIDLHKKEGDGYLLKEKGIKKKLSATIFQVITYPVKYLELRYGVSQFFIYLIFLFVVVGILVFLGMQTV